MPQQLPQQPKAKKIGEIGEGNKIVKFKEDADKLLVEQLEKDPKKNKVKVAKQPSPKKKVTEPQQQEVHRKKAPLQQQDEFLPDEDDFDQFGNDDLEHHEYKSGAKFQKGGAIQRTEEDDEEVELRPVKPGRTFLFGAVDNM